MAGTLRFLAGYARKSVRQYLLGLAALLATNYAVVRIPALLGDALNILGEEGPEVLAGARSIAIELMVLAVVVIAVRTLSRVLFFNPGREIEFHLGVDLFERLLGLQRPYFNRHKIGELVSVASNDTTSVRLLVGFAGLQVLNVAVAIPMHLWQMAVTDLWLTLWCLGPVVIGAAYMRWTVKRFFTMVRDGMQLLARLSDRVLEAYSGVGTVRAHAAEVATCARFEQRNAEYLALQLRVSSIRAFGMPVLAYSGLVGTGVVLWAGGNQVVAGELGVGDLATFTALLVSLVSTLTSLAWVLAAVGRGIVSADRVADLMHTPDELPVPDKTLEIRKPPRIEIHGLTFGFAPDEPPVLHDVDVRIDSGCTLGIFGKTGSGKSTLVNLLTRVYSPPPGSVTFDGVDIMRVDLAALRQSIAVVPQSPFLFSTSLRDNITLLDANPRARKAKAKAGEAAPPPVPSDPRLDEVIDAACLRDDLAQLPQGLDTIVGERGVMLSGGQRQRAALARALYRNRPVLILDDVLSAVDQGTEARLVAAIRSLRDAGGAAPTTIIVSHRTSVLEHADQILVLDGGRVVERGTHDELVRRGGVYAQTHGHQEGAG